VLHECSNTVFECDCTVLKVLHRCVHRCSIHVSFDIWCLMFWFAEHRWKNAINFTNPLGSKGRLTGAFATLLYQMWGQDLPYLTPIEFRVSNLFFLFKTLLHFRVLSEPIVSLTRRSTEIDLPTAVTIRQLRSTRLSRVLELLDGWDS